MTPKDMAIYYKDGLKAALQKQFLVVERVDQLGKMPQPGIYVETTVMSGAYAFEGVVVGSIKGMMVTATQQDSSNNDPLLRLFFFVPTDPVDFQAQKAASSYRTDIGIRVMLVTDIAEKFVTGGQDQFRKTHFVTRDLVAILSGESSVNFGEASFNELYKKADSKFASMYGANPDQQTIDVVGMMKFLLEVTGQLHLAESGVTGSGTFLNGDYGLFMTNIFNAIESIKSTHDRDSAISVDGRKDMFKEMARTFGMRSFDTGASFADTFEDFQKYNLCEFILKGRDTSTSLFFNPEIENSIYQITEAGAQDPREGFVDNVVQQDQLGAVEKLVASSLLGTKVSDNLLKIDQIKKITNTLSSTQAAKKSVSKSTEGLSNTVNTEMRSYLTVYKRILARAPSIIT